MDLRFYAADSLFHDAPRPLTLLNLSLTPQLVMHRRSDDQIARRLQISGHTLYMNEITLLRHALEQEGLGFYRTICGASGRESVKSRRRSAVRAERHYGDALAARNE